MWEFFLALSLALIIALPLLGFLAVKKHRKDGVRLRAEVEDLGAQLAEVRSHLNLLDPQAGAERNLEGGPSASRAEHDS